VHEYDAARAAARPVDGPRRVVDERAGRILASRVEERSVEDVILLALRMLVSRVARAGGEPEEERQSAGVSRVPAGDPVVDRGPFEPLPRPLVREERVRTARALHSRVS